MLTAHQSAHNALKVILAGVLGFALALAAPVLAAPLALNPGDRVTVTCESGLFVGPHQPTEIELLCAPLANATASASASAIASPNPSATAAPTGATATTSPSAAPTASPTTTPTLAPTSTPTPQPSPTQPPATPTPTGAPSPSPSTDCDTIQGYGSGATGGTRTVNVTSFSQLASAATTSGNRVVLQGGGLWDGNGATIRPASNVTIVDDSEPTVIKDAWILIRSSNVVLDNLRIRTGDESVSVDADAISLNGASNVAINRVEAIWAPDVGGITLLNGSRDVTVQCSIIGVGLTRSSHPESDDDTDGHNLAFNIAGGSSRVTVWKNLVTHSQGRNPQIQGGSEIDFINNVINGYQEGPSGNPSGLNLVGNWYRHGPQPQAAGMGAPWTHEWRTRTSGDFPSAFKNSVYASGNLSDGFTFTNGAASGVLRTTPAHPYSVTPIPVNDVLSTVLGSVGPQPLDSLSLRWITDAVNRSGTYYNGTRGPAPAIAW
jgi:pectate lyase